MVVYQLLGKTRGIDWASREEDEDLGLFSSPDKAQSKIDKIQSEPHWRMDWGAFTILPRQVV